MKILDTSTLMVTAFVSRKSKMCLRAPARIGRDVVARELLWAERARDGFCV
jgi:hypothetical protein